MHKDLKKRRHKFKFKPGKNFISETMKKISYQKHMIVR